ncbi:MAG TPA: SMP-30/gluconolactonase/LRE family protein [Gammaproteobacteria bacterium]
MTTSTRVAAAALLACAAVAPANGQDDGGSGCEPSGGLEFVCGPRNAEDLVLVPGTRWIIASGMTEGAGLALVDSESGEWSVLYPAPNARARHDAAAYPGCATPPAPATFNTHGLSLRATGQGRAMLYAVAHGEREAIEAFEVDATGERPVLTWKGCAHMPEGLPANSVASLPDGSLLATVLLMPGTTFADSVAKKPTGAVFEWSPGDDEFALVRGSELPSNNGIEVSADGREFYVASSGFQTIVAFARENPTRQLRSSAPLPITPDNVHLGPDGLLYTAGMKNDVPACGGPPGPQHTLEALSTCPRGTIALTVDPETMEHTVVLDTPDNPAFSNATMALPVGDRLWIGTFRGDRIAYAPRR